VIAPDLPGIGDSSIPTDKIDMITSANRIHALVHSSGIEESKSCRSRIWTDGRTRMRRSSRENGKLVVMDAFLPGVAGWEPILHAPNIWHFRFQTRIPKSC